MAISRALMQRIAQRAIGVFGNIPESCTYTSKAAGVENLTTGIVTATGTATANVPVVFDDYKEFERINPDILQTDSKAYIARLDLPTTPSKGDTITRPSGRIMRVVRWKTDPAEALWILQVRVG